MSFDRKALMQIAMQRRWDAYHDGVDALLRRQDTRAVRRKLEFINRVPDDGVRTGFLDRYLTQLQARAGRLSPQEASDYLSILYILKKYTDLSDNWAALEKVLPDASRRFFGKHLQGEASSSQDAGADTGVNAAQVEATWCLGLSKTGTNSFHAYMEDLGRSSQHFLNDVTKTIISREDCLLFDSVSDTPVVHIARQDGIPDTVQVVASVRGFGAWEKSFLNHFRGYFVDSAEAATPSFEAMKEKFFDGTPFLYGDTWWDLHHNLYFRHNSTREAFESHADWISDLSLRMGDRCLVLPIEAEDKAAQVAKFMGLAPSSKAYPHRNSRGTATGPLDRLRKRLKAGLGWKPAQALRKLVFGTAARPSQN